jgi:SAM-dependent methyltransferase
LATSPGEIANVEQAANWDGPQGAYWAEHEERFSATIRPHGRRLLEAARISAGEHVLDVGCGCGESTRGAACAAVPGAVLGVDLSSRMLERARELSRAEGLSNASFEQADAQVHPFEPEAFDLAISRFGSMFFADPVAAFRNVRSALRPGGRLAIVAWQELARNPWQSEIRDALAIGRTLPEPPPDAPGAFAFGDPRRVRAILDEAGFADVELEGFEEPVCLGADAGDAFDFVGGMPMLATVLDGLEDAEVAQARDELRSTLAAHETDRGVCLDSSVWLITARR